MNIKTGNIIKSALLKEQNNNGWGLCIGAGTSYPTFPTWNSLVENMIAKDKTIKKPKEVASELLNKFSPDSLIQAVQNLLQLSDNNFANLIAEELYEGMKSKISTTEWESVRTIMESYDPHSEKDPDWKNFINVREKLFNGTSAYQIAKFVVAKNKVGITPKCIISFNAETLLYSLINSFQREPYLNKVKKKGEMKTIIERITHTISTERFGRIPYIFCHGLLLAPLSKAKSKLLTDSDKLVFSESSYLSLANSAFSWQSNEFISYCSKLTLVFIGVSLTDPNMRRWLSWVHSLKLHELKQNMIIPEKSLNKVYSHFWINRIPKNTDEKKWIEACVQHLGVKIIWIKNWGEVGKILEKLTEK